MQDKSVDAKNTLATDALGVLADKIIAAVQNEDFETAWNLMKTDIATAWFAIPPARTYEHLQLFIENIPDDKLLQQLALLYLDHSSPDQIDSGEYLSKTNFDDPQQRLWADFIRMLFFRVQGRVADAVEQSHEVISSIDSFQENATNGTNEKLHAIMQIGVTAMLNGEFVDALQCFEETEKCGVTAKEAFLFRDAKTKSALIHAAYGDPLIARELLAQIPGMPRTSSWVENEIDSHRELAEIILAADENGEAYDRLAALNLQDVGEFWPFYVLAFYRVLQAEQLSDEVQQRMEMFDTLPFAKIDGQCFNGSIIPVKRAMIALQAGRSAEVQQFLDRADPKIPYTQLFQAAADIYARRTKQALRGLHSLRVFTRGLRTMEVRRLALQSAAHYLSSDVDGCLRTLEEAASISGGLRPSEVKHFSSEIRQLAQQHIPDWPQGEEASSVFIETLMEAESALSVREIEIVDHLAKGSTVGELPEQLFISQNTLKTHLQSIYRKLGVNSARDAVLEAQSRGIL